MKKIYRYYRALVYDKETKEEIQCTTYMTMKDLLDFISSLQSYANDFFFVKIKPENRVKRIWWIDETEEDILLNEDTDAAE